MKNRLLKVTTAVLCMAMPSIVLAKDTTEAEKLRKEVTELMKRLDKLEKGHGQANACDLKICSHCPPTVKSPPEGKMKVTLSGQVNKAVAYFDDGHRSSIQEVDNDVSSTRFDLKGVGTICDWEAGFEYMAEVIDNSTRNTTIRGNTNNPQSPLTRIFEVFGTYKPWRAQVELGMGYTASYYTQNYADWITASTVATDGAKGVSEMGTALVFFDQTTNAPSAGVSGPVGAGGVITVGNVFDPADGLGRRNRVRINIGPWSGFTLSSSHNFNLTDNTDVALRYAGEWCKWLVAAAIAYCEQHQNTVIPKAPNTGPTNAIYRQVNGSAGFLSPIGISFMFAGAHRDWRVPTTKDGKSYYEKLGYEAWLTEVGKTAVAVYAMQTRNMCFIFGQGGEPAALAAVNLASMKNKGDAYGAVFVQKIDRIATELYIAWENLRYKQKGLGAHKFKRIDIGLFGARIKF